jgi:hypothetical protein
VTFLLLLCLIRQWIYTSDRNSNLPYIIVCCSTYCAVNFHFFTFRCRETFCREGRPSRSCTTSTAKTSAQTSRRTSGSPCLSVSQIHTYLLCKGVFRIRIRIIFDSWIRIGIADPVSGYSTFTHTGNVHISPSFFEDKLMLPPVLQKDEKKSKYSVVIQLTTWIRISIEIFGWHWIRKLNRWGSETLV